MSDQLAIIQAKEARSKHYHSNKSSSRTKNKSEANQNLPLQVLFSPEGPSSSGCGAIELFDANEQKHCFSGSCICSSEKEILQRYLSHVKVNKSAEQPGRGIYLSRICDMTLTEFILARKLYCKMQVHFRWEECTQCLPLIKLANEISGHGLCQVSSLFKNLFSSNRYRSEKAVRKLMQLPVAVFELEIPGKGSQRLFVTELNTGLVLII